MDAYWRFLSEHIYIHWFDALLISRILEFRRLPWCTKEGALRGSSLRLSLIATVCKYWQSLYLYSTRSTNYYNIYITFCFCKNKYDHMIEITWRIQKTHKLWCTYIRTRTSYCTPKYTLYFIYLWINPLFNHALFSYNAYSIFIH